MHVYKIAGLALLLSLSGCAWFSTKNSRATIFDRVVTIPKELVLDVPYLPPLCDEIADLKVPNGAKLF